MGWRFYSDIELGWYGLGWSEMGLAGVKWMNGITTGYGSDTDMDMDMDIEYPFLLMQ